MEAKTAAAERTRRQAERANQALRKAQAVLVTAKASAKSTGQAAEEATKVLRQAYAQREAGLAWTTRCPVLHALGEAFGTTIFVCLTYPTGSGHKKNKKRYTTPYYKFRQCTDLSGAFLEVLDTALKEESERRRHDDDDAQLRRPGPGPVVVDRGAELTLDQADYEGMRILYQDRACWSCWTVCDADTTVFDMPEFPMFQLELRRPLSYRRRRSALL